MANINAIHSVGSSLLTYLRNAYPEPLRTDHPCEFRLLSSGELVDTSEFGTTVSLYLYRVIINEHVRNRPPSRNPPEGPLPLTVDLHMLLTVWADSAVAEQTICAWVMHQLHQRPIMDSSSLSTDGGWQRDDVVHIIPAELSNEDLMRIWDALTPTYRLSVSYIARVVRIDPLQVETGRRVVATRDAYEEIEVTADD